MNFYSTCRSLLEDATLLVYPDLCPGCNVPLNSSKKRLCMSCRLRLPLTDFHTDPNNMMYQAFHGRMLLVQAFSMLHFKKRGITRELLHHIKYHQGKELTLELGREFGYQLQEAKVKRPDALVPVPLHKKKLTQRGFNQSALFAEGVSQSWGVPVDEHVLVKTVATQTQTKMSRWVRWKNVADVFDVAEPETAYGKHLMVVDDVMTTGATLESCGKKLLAAGCRNVSVMTLAYAQQ